MQIQINLPDFLDIREREIKMILASHLYEEGKLSLGQAAQTAGVSKRTFMELLGDYGVSVFNHPPEDLEQDLQNALGKE